MDNLFQLLVDRVGDRSARHCIETCAGVSYTYAELIEAAGRYAALLFAQGARPGDRIAVCVEKTPQALFLYWACQQLGVIYLPLNTAYQTTELEYFLCDARPVIIVCDPAMRDAVYDLNLQQKPLVILTLDRHGNGSLIEDSRLLQPLDSISMRSGQDIAALLYTSGTTGRSKGAMLSHANLISNAHTLCELWEFTEHDTLLHALPLFHVHGLFVAQHCALLSGAKILLMPGFDARATVQGLPLATVFMGVPTYYTRMLAESELNPTQCASIRLFICGSAPLLPAVFDQFKAATGHAILERYGMTETGMITSNPVQDRRPGKAGLPLPGVEVRITQGMKIQPENAVGVLEVRGPNVFQGYWQMPEQTTKDFRSDGFFVTGDLAFRDSAGYIEIVGRDKDLVITGGYNVYPREIEILLDAMAGIRESAVIGIPHADFGEAVTAVVVCEPGVLLDEKQIIAQLKVRLAAYKVPKRIHFVAELPRNPLGKVQKNALRAHYAMPRGH